MKRRRRNKDFWKFPDGNVSWHVRKGSKRTDLDESILGFVDDLAAVAERDPEAFLERASTIVLRLGRVVKGSLDRAGDRRQVRNAAIRTAAQHVRRKIRRG